jgi:hypothetical protein
MQPLIRLPFHRQAVRMLPPQLFEMRQSVRTAAEYYPGQYRNQACFARRGVLQAWMRLGYLPCINHFGRLKGCQSFVIVGQTYAYAYIWNNHFHRDISPRLFLRHVGCQRLQASHQVSMLKEYSMIRIGTCHGRMLLLIHHSGLEHHRI